MTSLFEFMGRVSVWAKKNCCHPEPRIFEVKELVFNTRYFAAETFAHHDKSLLNCFVKLRQYQFMILLKTGFAYKLQDPNLITSQVCLLHCFYRN